jgi:fructokinase
VPHRQVRYFATPSFDAMPDRISVTASAPPKPLRLGIDLGGTKTEGVVLDAGGRELARRRIATDQSSYDAVLGGVAGLYAELLWHADEAPHTLGIGTPGSLSPRTGLMRNSNTLCLNGRPVASDLRARLGRAFTLENDANCFALAEATAGAGAGHRVVFGVIMGTGCGGGIVIDGRVHTGRQSLAGEWGHTTLDPHGPQCFCGQRGCVETYISGSGLERAHFDATGFRMSAQEIVAAADAGEAACRTLMDGFFDAFGRAMANLMAVLDPDIVVLGGGLSNVDALYSRGVAEVGKRIFGGELSTPIVKHRLGDSAGVIGAALIGT